MDENLDVKKIVEKIKTEISNDSDVTISAENIVQQASESNSKNTAQSRSDSLETKKIIQDFEKFDNISKIPLVNADDSFDENLIQANMSYDIQTITKIETLKPKIIRGLVLKFRHIIQNEIRSTLNSIVNNQIKFNIHMVRSVTGLKKLLDSVELKQQRTNELVDSVELKQQLRTNELVDSENTLAVYLAYMFYLKRKPTINEIKSWLPNISNHEKFLDLINAIGISEEALQIQKTELQSKGIILLDGITAYKKVDEHIIHFYLQDRTYLEPFSQNLLYEQEETTLLKKLLKKDMNVINIGANIGYFTLLAARQVGPQGKVFAFEPFPKTVELLQKNIDANGYSNVEVIPMAVSSKSGIAKLSTGGSSLHNIISSREIKEMTVIEIPQTSIDDFVSKKQIKIDFMIIDAEGSEPFILDGMKNTLENNPNLAIMIEFNPYTLDLAGSSAVEFLKIISNNEYLIYLIDETTQKVTPITVQQLEQDIEPPQVANLLLSKTQLMDI